MKEIKREKKLRTRAEEMKVGGAIRLENALEANPGRRKLFVTLVKA